MSDRITPRRLTTPEFHARVHALNPAIAVFDCDGTLWSPDAGSAFMHWTIDTKLISTEQIASIQDRYERYRRGEVSEYEICGQMVQVYRGLPEKALREAAAHFFRDYIEPYIFPELSTLVAELQRRHCDIWAVSSTNQWVIEEGVRRFDIPASNVLAARVEVEHGIITDRLIHVPTDEDKVEALRRVGIVDEGNPPNVAFGNSIHDAAMLSIACSVAANGADGEPAGRCGAFPVNPSVALLERATDEGWPVYYPALVRP